MIAGSPCRSHRRGDGRRNAQQCEHEEKFQHAMREVHALKPRVVLDDGEFREDPDQHAETGDRSDRQGTLFPRQREHRSDRLRSTDDDAEYEVGNDERRDRAVREIHDRNTSTVQYERQHRADHRGQHTEHLECHEYPTEVAGREPTTRDSPVAARLLPTRWRDMARRIAEPVTVTDQSAASQMNERFTKLVTKIGTASSPFATKNRRIQPSRPVAMNGGAAHTRAVRESWGRAAVMARGTAPHPTAPA